MKLIDQDVPLKIASEKQRLQAEFVAQCEREGLSAREAAVRASAFPVVPADQIKIRSFPKF